MNQGRAATREKWRRIITSQRASGQTAAGWCREHRVTQASFFAWKRRLQSAAPAGEFVEVRAAAACGRADADAAEDKPVAIEVCCRGGRRLLLRRGFDPALLAETIRVLEGLPSGLDGLPCTQEGLPCRPEGLA
jgi:hypothetical protein